MLVSLNPGHPLRLAEKYGSGWDELALLRRHDLVATASSEAGIVLARRRTTVTPAAAKDVADICWRSYCSSTGARDHLFHRRSVAYAKVCLWLTGGDPRAWREHCWFTDAVKCSTVAESNAGIPDRAIANCRRHLADEIRTVRPAIIAVLGRPALKATQNARAEAKSPAPLLLLLHPSRWRRLTEDRQRTSFAGFTHHAPARSPTSGEFAKFLNELQSELERPPQEP